MIAEIIADLLRVTFASSAAILFVLILRRPMRVRFGAHVAYLLWSLVPIAMLVALLPAPTIPAALIAKTPVGAPITMNLIPLNAAAAPMFDSRELVFGGWVFGAMAFCTFFFVQQRRFVSRLGKLSLSADRVWRADSEAACPALVGALSPRIVVPNDFDSRYDARERALILAHERMHAVRGDAQANLFVAMLRCLFWFNPLFHFAASRFRFDQELACDAAVISRFPEARRSYADAMLKTQLADVGLPVGCHWQSSHPLKERISMLNKNLPSRMRRSVGVALSAAIVIAGAGAGWAAQPKNIVQESNGAGGSDATGFIETDLTFKIDGADIGSDWKVTQSVPHLTGSGFQTLKNSATFTTPPATQFTLSLTSTHNAGETWDIEGTSDRSSDGKMQFAGIVKHNGDVVAQPRVTMLENQPASLKIGEESNGQFKGFETQVTLARPDIAQAQNIAKWDAEAAASAAASAPNTRASLRSLHRIDYPTEQAKSGADGTVFVLAHVGANGNVVSTSIQRSAGSTRDGFAFDQAAMSGVQTWTFNPAKKNGVAAASDEVVPVVFSHDPKSPVDLAGATTDAIRISPEVAPAAASIDHPPTESVEYRKMIPPHYPVAAIQAKQQGEIIVKVLIDENGKPQQAEVEKADPPEAAQVFGGTSIAAVMQWSFEPGMKDGKPYAGYALVPFTYSLKED